MAGRIDWKQTVIIYIFAILTNSAVPVEESGRSDRFFFFFSREIVEMKEP